MFKYALNLLLRHKLRTFLTSLGITISVVLLSYIIFGMRDLQNLFINEFSSRFTPNEVIVSRSGLTPGAIIGTGQAEGDEASEEPKLLSKAAAEDIESLDYVINSYESLLITSMQVSLEGENKVFGQSFIMARELRGDATYFTDFVGVEEEVSKGKVFVSRIVSDFFGFEGDEMVGKTIVVEPSTSTIFAARNKSQLDSKFTFEVVGIANTGGDRIDVAMTLEDGLDMVAKNGGFSNTSEYIENFGYDQIYVQVEEGKVEEFKTYIEDTYGFEALTAEDVLEILDLITVGITAVLVFFGIVSAVVASIGIINTMVMAIYEQTREIGINKAIGASNRQILLIFLIQSGLIGFFGSLVGLIIVLTGMFFADGLIVKELEAIGFTTDHFFTFDPIVTASIILVSILVGILAGLYPAFKAARLDPVKALRYE